jgi:uracil-DNA glycosylase
VEIPTSASRDTAGLEASGTSLRSCPTPPEVRKTPVGVPRVRALRGRVRIGSDVSLVGGQPGHEEDLAGRPFIEPAGRLPDRGLAAAAIDRTKVYVTTVVKHFKLGATGEVAHPQEAHGMTHPRLPSVTPLRAGGGPACAGRER